MKTEQFSVYVRSIVNIVSQLLKSPGSQSKDVTVQILRLAIRLGLDPIISFLIAAKS